jgi:hypothetical protein
MMSLSNRYSKTLKVFTLLSCVLLLVAATCTTPVVADPLDASDAPVDHHTYHPHYNVHQVSGSSTSSSIELATVSNTLLPSCSKVPNPRVLIIATQEPFGFSTTSHLQPRLPNALFTFRTGPSQIRSVLSLGALSDSYDAVIIGGQHQITDSLSAQLSDALADFVDAGGVVAMTTFSFVGDRSWSIRNGRLMQDPAMSPISPSNEGSSRSYTVSSSQVAITVVSPSHPVMTGIGSAWTIGGRFAVSRDQFLRSDATLIAEDSFSRPRLAINANKNVMCQGTWFRNPFRVPSPTEYNVLANSINYMLCGGAESDDAAESDDCQCDKFIVGSGCQSAQVASANNNCACMSFADDVQDCNPSVPDSTEPCEA